MATASWGRSCGAMARRVQEVPELRGPGGKRQRTLWPASRNRTFSFCCYTPESDKDDSVNYAAQSADAVFPPYPPVSITVSRPLRNVKIRTSRYGPRS